MSKLLKVERFVARYSTQIYLFLFTVAYGLFYMTPVATFGDSVYKGQAFLAPEWVWGIISLLLGLAGFVALRSKSLFFKKATYSCLFFFWLFQSGLMAVSNIHSPMGECSFCQALVALYLLLFSYREVRFW